MFTGKKIAPSTSTKETYSNLRFSEIRRQYLENLGRFKSLQPKVLSKNFKFDYIYNVPHCEVTAWRFLNIYTKL